MAKADRVDMAKFEFAVRQGKPIASSRSRWRGPSCCAWYNCRWAAIHEGRPEADSCSAANSKFPKRARRANSSTKRSRHAKSDAGRSSKSASWPGSRGVLGDILNGGSSNCFRAHRKPSVPSLSLAAPPHAPDSSGTSSSMPCDMVKRQVRRLGAFDPLTVPFFFLFFSLLRIPSRAVASDMRKNVP